MCTGNFPEPTNVPETFRNPQRPENSFCTQNMSRLWTILWLVATNPVDGQAQTANVAERTIKSHKKLRRLCGTGKFCEYMTTRNISYTAATQESEITKMYDAYHTSRGGDKFEALNDLVLKLILEFFPPSKYSNILDAGVGQCHMVKELLKRGYSHVRGQEISQYAIDNFCSGAHVNHGFLKKTTYADAEFDVITSIDVIEHVPLDDVPATLKEMRRLLKSNGLFIFKLGPCAKDCGGFCAMAAIHPSGICDRLNYDWWRTQALDAGFRDLSQDRAASFEASLGIFNLGCCDHDTGLNSVTNDKCMHPDRILPCSVSQKGTNIFLFSA